MSENKIITARYHSQGSVVDVMAFSIKIMFSMAGIFGIAAFIAMSSIPLAATRITNRLRLEYLKVVVALIVVAMIER